MKNKYFIGIDLGLKGSISIISNNGNLILCEPIPTIKVLVNKKMRNQYDITSLNAMFKLWISDYSITGAMIERLRAIPRQASQVSFSMGGSTMLFKALFTVYNIPYREVEPRTWQKKIFGDLGIQYTSKTTKDASILAAKQLFPSYSFKRTNKCKIDDHNMTDSACISYFLMQTI